MLIYFRKWYTFSEEDIEELTWPKFLNYAQGVAIFEKTEWDRISPPSFSDKTNSMKFYRSIDQRLQAMWDSIFPRTKEYKEEKKQAMLAFKERSRKRRENNASGKPKSS